MTGRPTIRPTRFHMANPRNDISAQEALPDAAWTVNLIRSSYACVTPVGEKDSHGESATPALALCAALMRALATKV